ncbi:hypothetical protein JX265_005825 [Neoarthrinium moseri]|uniref:Heterokaryon incompatibility domain-containing protein n=1 Tax=Neoarthrinium moseri TaxID=1658444 RepID=A0A9P9WNF1_9PEZI|nr:hypothetical protein JX265_005825 [Neoarthrinium moseri]
MWLINVETHKLEEHYTCPEGQYAVLSHTWDGEEVSFQEYKCGLDEAKKKKGYTKIEWTIRLAQRRGLAWAWVDTCCIDKSSSAELSEAINSMWKWYKQSAICYAYLSDLPEGSIGGTDLFQHCRWWKRGWTLQELIAPTEVHFYDRGWNFYETRTGLKEYIEDFTGISHEAYHRPPDSFSVAQRMSWSANRETLRTEDIAYCLLGLFDINMPLLYGEGEKAFIRLQEEICRNTTDLSVFAWTADIASTKGKADQEFRGLFALHPSEFAGCGNVIPHKRSQTHYHDDLSITRRGICFDSMKLELVPQYGLMMPIGTCKKLSGGLATVRVFLTKTIGGYVRSEPGCVGIKLQPAYRGSKEDDIKSDGQKICFFSMRDTMRFPPMRIWCEKTLTASDSMRLHEVFNNALFIDLGRGVQITAAYPEGNWDPHKQAFLHDGVLIGAVLIEAQSQSFILLCKWWDATRLREAAAFQPCENFEYTIVHQDDLTQQNLRQIQEERMETPGSFNIARDIMYGTPCNSLDASTASAEPLICQGERGGYDLRGDLGRRLVHGEDSLRLRLSIYNPHNAHRRGKTRDGRIWAKRYLNKV